MKKNKVMRMARKDVIISIRITKDMKKFIEKEKLSPSLVFITALKKLGYPKV